jgi:hypothetical protein
MHDVGTASVQVLTQTIDEESLEQREFLLRSTLTEYDPSKPLA